MARHLRSPALCCLAGTSLGGAVAGRDPERARRLFRESAEYGRAAGIEQMTAFALARLARMGTGAIDSAWVRDFRAAVDLHHELGGTQNVEVTLQFVRSMS